MKTPEFRLKSLRGQDRSVKHQNYALETDKGIQKWMNIQSELTQYKKRKITKRNLIPTVADQVEAATQGNVTGAAATLLDLTTLFFALSIMATAISTGVSALRQSGLV